MTRHPSHRDIVRARRTTEEWNIECHDASLRTPLLEYTQNTPRRDLATPSTSRHMLTPDSRVWPTDRLPSAKHSWAPLNCHKKAVLSREVYLLAPAVCPSPLSDCRSVGGAKAKSPDCTCNQVEGVTQLSKNHSQASVAMDALESFTVCDGTCCCVMSN